jgi:crotonobetainyl-CoA:carnitine CoA-transferase CaiB-like acyl-CoA transferase
MSNLYDGIRIVDFTSNAAGPHCTALFADYGAEILKIEKMKVGDESRYFPPVYEGASLPFMYYNRGKKSIVVDMADPEGFEFVNKLIANADVVLEASKPGSMKKLGFDYETVKKVNPNIIYCSISLNGSTGPKSGAAGYDAIGQAGSGIMDLTGSPDGPPVMCGLTMADYSTATYAFGAINAALFHRERTGKGQYIDLSLVECLASYNAHVVRASIGINITRTGNHHATLCPFGVFQGNVGTVVICAPGQAPWRKLCALMGEAEIADEEWCSDNAHRVSNREKVIGMIEGWLKSFESIDEAIALLESSNVPSAKIKATSELLTDEQLLARGMIVDIKLPSNVTSISSLKGFRTPLHFSELEPISAAAPVFGEHLIEYLRKVGHSEDDARRLAEKWVG